MNFTDYTLDLETMGVTRQTAAIVSIGAVAFNVDGDMSEPFCVNVDLEDAMRHGLTVDADTIKWWMRQQLLAREAIFIDPKPLRVALNLLSDWVKKTCKDAPCWTHATFDAPVLSNAFAAIGEKQPTHFRKQRDIRTLTDFYLKVVSKDLPVVGREGVHHNAADDAVFQAKYISKMLRGLTVEWQSGRMRLPAKEFVG